MNARRHWMILLALAVSTAAFAGCGKSAAKSMDETLSLPFRGVRAGVRGIGKGAGAIGEAGGGIFGRLLTDRNHTALVREHKDTFSHLTGVEKQIERRQIGLNRLERRLLRDAHDRLAAIGRQLEAKRIPAGVGKRMYTQLDGVRQSLNLFRQRHNTPRYTGFIAVR